MNALYDLGSRRYVDALVQPRRQADEVGAFVSMIDRFPFDERVFLPLIGDMKAIMSWPILNNVVCVI